jgi:hypothetical protein
MTIRFKQNSIEFDNGIKTFTLNEVSGGFTFNGQLAASDFYGAFQGTVAGYTSGGGYTVNNTIDKFPFATNANATDVGDLTVARSGVAGQSSSVSGYASGGAAPSGSNNTIDKFPFASDGNATDVGDLTIARSGAVGQSSSVSGYNSGGYSGAPTNTIDKFPFSADANATDVGDLTIARYYPAGQTSSVSGYNSGGIIPTPSPIHTNIIDKFSFATNANATDVGDLSVVRYGGAGQSSSVSGYTACGKNPSLPPTSGLNTIDKFPFASDGNATDVGDLSLGRYYAAGQSSTVSGYTSSGYTGLPTNTIDKFPFSTDANATDVGDVTVARYLDAGQQH